MSPWVIGTDGLVHLHRRFDDGGSRTWCGALIHPVHASDFIKAPRQHQRQCIRCQDAKFRDGGDGGDRTHA